MAERFEIVQRAIESMLNGKKYTTLRDILATMNPSDPRLSTLRKCLKMLRRKS